MWCLRLLVELFVSLRDWLLGCVCDVVFSRFGLKIRLESVKIGAKIEKLGTNPSRIHKRSDVESPWGFVGPKIDCNTLRSESRESKKSFFVRKWSPEGNF